MHVQLETQSLARDSPVSLSATLQRQRDVNTFNTGHHHWLPISRAHRIGGMRKWRSILTLTVSYPSQCPIPYSIPGLTLARTASVLADSASLLAR